MKRPSRRRPVSRNFELEKCTAFVLPNCDLGVFQRLFRKIGNMVRARVNTGFACILEKFEYDCFGGRNLRVWFESYLRSHSFNGLASVQSLAQSVKPVGLMPAQLLLSAPAPSRPSPRRHKCSSSF